ncbi:PREDICTED: cyclin-dependent kinase inhibitor 6 [Camelina sativa]|uniref:Cyclin-dependent kinase inhibitor 6 n=1 Tax=Camelina sativa TaxID=90675 RepID=A0ABM0XLU4_CAMSA|nr:PREDICTED: cyclin-dependent kinase inhibitor 6 [Camelina sativa]
MSERKRELEEEEEEEEEEEASSTSVSLSHKKTKLDDDSDPSSESDSHDVVAAVSSYSSHSVASSEALASDECSDTSTGEANDQRSQSSSSSIIISSGCCCCFSKEIAMNRSTFVTDLEFQADQISEKETKSSTLITTSCNFRKEKSPVSEGLGETTTEMESEVKGERRKQPEVSKTPTAAEIEGFFSELENEAEDKKKRFIEKYNFDIVNDEPLQGRYKWDRLL